MSLVTHFLRSSGVESTWTDGDEANNLANVGEKVSHICTIKNDGTTSLENFCITSDSFDEGCQECPRAGTLIPGEAFTCMIEIKVKYVLVFSPLRAS